jgi:hypothetical protein
MAFLGGLFRSRPADPKAALAKARESALAVRSLADIVGEPTKAREIAGLVENLRAAEKALETGYDEHGRPVAPVQVGQGLTRTVGYLKQHGIWTRLHAGASRETRAQLGQLDKEMAKAVKVLGKAVSKGPVP